MVTVNSHETFERNEPARKSSDRGFGFVFATAFGAIGLWPVIGLVTPIWWALILSALFLATAIVRPSLLAPLNRLWARFGRVLQAITNPLIMGIVFFGTVTPTGFILRALGKDPLRLRREPDAVSYWIERDPPGPAPDSMDHQF